MVPYLTFPQALIDNKVREEDPSAPVFNKDLNLLMIKPAGNVAELKCQARGTDLSYTWLKVRANGALWPRPPR